MGGYPVGHLAGGKEEAYQALAERLSRFPVGVVINDTLMEILQLLYTKDEADAGSKFPLKPRPLAEIAGLIGMPAEKAGKFLNGMAEKGLVTDISRKGTTYYMLNPIVVGFFEFSLMRNDRANLRELSSLFERYLHDRSVVKEIFGADTKMFRSLVYENYIPELVQTEVLSYEKAERVIRESGGGGLSICACRHKSYHLGKPCSYPMEDVCTSLGRPAEWVLRHGFARKASVDDLLKNLERTYKLGLVLTCDNVIDEPAYICHCCGCCCGVLQSIRDYEVHSIQPSNFMPQIDPDTCLSCDACIEACHINALKESGGENPVLDCEICIGCGVCASVCPGGAIQMVRQEQLHTPPQNKITQMINIALERNRFS
jgi:Pyruvate/2-oxoacid:ferredoxin oxidoreductase delta subunit